MAGKRSSTRAKGGAPTPTPMMAQYLALKSQAGDCLLFYRMGDFFELFHDDAKVAAGVLDIALTKRGKSEDGDVPMCGVPVHSAASYLAKLIRVGHKVAIAEQVETPSEARKRAGSKALVERAIVRTVTAGTLTEDALLDARRGNMLASVAEAGGEMAIAAADISTGRFETVLVPPGALAAELARIDPSEVVLPAGAEPLGAATEAQATEWNADDFDSDGGARRFEKLFGEAPSCSRAELAAAGGLLGYILHVSRGTMPFLEPLRPRDGAAFLAIDRPTRRSLELTEATDGGRQGSLLHCIDRTVTAGGARLLAEDIAAPLIDRAPIGARQGFVAWFHDDGLVRSDVREALKALPDLERALGRVAAGRGGPRDVGHVRDGLAGARLLADRARDLADLPSLFTGLLDDLGGHAALVDLLTRALVESPSVEAGQGGFIAAGYDAALDELRDAGANGRRTIAALETRYREDTGVAALKIKHNAVLGYFVEVPAKHGDTVMRDTAVFTHRQTLAGAVRFNSFELHETASRIEQAGGHALAAEAAHLEELVGQVRASAEGIARTARALARIDVAAALATRAAEDGWCRPALCDEPVLDIRGGRHPVVEAALRKGGGSFVPNNTRLGTDDRLWLVSGPNMGGKSTFLRQNALIVVLAQAGGFVPADTATVGIVDRLFSRVGASDNLAQGQSTFMVEMVETAAILNQATARSFVILDEVGRGTSTYDGLALAWAVVEAVHERNRCRCLFATHYHELSRLAEQLDALSLRHVRARSWKGELVLLHELATGPADRSYGLEVAKLAGVPAPVLARAKDVLEKLEAGRAETGGLAAGLGDLPLFQASIAREPKVDRLRERLAGLDLDTLSPRAALDELYAIKSLSEQES